MLGGGGGYVAEEREGGAAAREGDRRKGRGLAEEYWACRRPRSPRRSSPAAATVGRRWPPAAISTAIAMPCFDPLDTPTRGTPQ